MDDAEKREMWMRERRYLHEQLAIIEQRRIEAEARGLEAQQRGLEQGRIEGRMEGELKGKTELLLKLLERRFGVIPEAQVMQIQTADAVQLDQWTERFIAADSLADIFAANQ